DSELLPELAPERLDQRFAAVDAAARQQPVLLPRLLLAAQEDPALPSEDGADADPRLHQRPDDPKPPLPRSLGGSSSTSCSSTGGTGRITSWAIRIPGSITNVSARSWFTRFTRSSPR